ncbi:mismatch-specific DNA-glycosylase [Aspergillus brunneoviolaceus CBS 621.78]|uniref:DNA glycosylase n=1 Tax=Aspergillus brunneoviolaceus CBS 621.78 TaxID=1450534 RepID=A0ACD1GDA6_9EURO|nr:DNA glycosylase [Aspergillus brunneoviolaceus CBS 621.78]RAH47192.1 DNA glycosylase [Aspergillus brunneoviolaceus CBS 621.78]
MGRLIKNHWARLIILTAAAFQIGSAVEGFIWPKVFWDFMTKNLNGAVTPIPILQILNLLMGLVGIAWEWPLKYVAGSIPHRSIEFRLILYPLSALLAMLLYQGTDPAIYYLIGIGVYFWAYSEGEVCGPRSHRTGNATAIFAIEMSSLDGTRIENVPVNKKTSFNGRLNQYFHTAKNIATEPPTLKPTTTTTTTTTNNASQDLATTRSKPLTPSSPSPSPSPSSSPSTTPKSTTTNPRHRRTRTRTPKPPTPPTTPSLLRDTIPKNLDLLLVGVNPGILTGVTGHAYAHPSNLFWKLLHWSGITAIRHPPSDTYALPGLYNIGNTNIVERPTRDASMLSRAEMDAGVPVLEAKVAAQRPAVVCLVGKSIWEAVWRVKTGRRIRKEEFRYGWQDEGMNMGAVISGDEDGGGGEKNWPGARVFVATTTSGLAAGMSVAEKQAVWNELGVWVKKRRGEREEQQQQQQQKDRSVDEDNSSRDQ